LKKKNDIFFYIFLSIIAAILIFVLAYFDASKTNVINFYDKLFVAGFVIVGCILGISLAFFPRWYKKSLTSSKKSQYKKDESVASRRRKGHHPDCDEFKDHVFKFKKKVYCTGCFGLAAGAFSSIIFIIIYLTINNKIALWVNYVLLFFGFILIAFNLAEIMLPNRHKFIHIFSNIFLMIGFLIIVIGIFEITESKTYAIIGIIFTFLWLYTRIQLSNLRHSMTCEKCKEKCKMYL
jgi:hypothetical protein